MVAFSSSSIYFTNSSQIGGVPDDLEWRGKFDLLPQRFTDLSYFDVIEDISNSFKEDNSRLELVRGVCDQDEEVKINSVRFSSSGEHLTINKSNLDDLGIKGGDAASFKEILTKENLEVELIFLKAPQTIIEEVENPSDEVSDSSNEKLGSGNDEPSGFGETRLESYAGKIVVIPIGMESLIRKTKFEFIQRIIKKAEEDKASAIIFDLNTPGGIAWYT